jgi:hypothetical protein
VHPATDRVLKYDDRVRLVYLDEAGIGDPAKDQFSVMAGVMVDADTQWKPLQKHFASLVERFVPADQREGFVFHAMDIWHGSGVFDRKSWKGDRFEVIRSLCETITEFKLPVVLGHSNKVKVVEAVPDIRGPKEINRTAFMGAFAECAVEAEQWMRMYAPKEVAVLVAENNNELRRYAKAIHNIFSRGEVPEFMFDLVKELPYQNLIDTVYSAEKREAPPLQLADLMAFLYRRFLVGVHSDRGRDAVAQEHLFSCAPSSARLMKLVHMVLEKRAKESTDTPDA